MWSSCTFCTRCQYGHDNLIIPLSFNIPIKITKMTESCLLLENEGSVPNGFFSDSKIFMWFDICNKEILFLRESSIYKWRPHIANGISYPVLVYSDDTLFNEIMHISLSLDAQFIAIQYSSYRIEVVEIFSRKKWEINVNMTYKENYIIPNGILWSEHGGTSQDLIIVTHTCIELYKVSSIRKSCKVSHRISHPSINFLYEASHRVLILISSTDNSSDVIITGFFLQYDISDLPKLSLPPPIKTPSISIPSGDSEATVLVSLYGILYLITKVSTLETDTLVFYTVHKLGITHIQSIIINIGKNVSYSVTDNLLCCHCNDSFMTYIFDVKLSTDNINLQKEKNDNNNNNKKYINYEYEYESLYEKSFYLKSIVTKKSELYDYNISYNINELKRYDHNNSNNNNLQLIMDEKFYKRKYKLFNNTNWVYDGSTGTLYSVRCILPSVVRLKDQINNITLLNFLSMRGQSNLSPKSFREDAKYYLPIAIDARKQFLLLLSQIIDNNIRDVISKDSAESLHKTRWTKSVSLRVIELFLVATSPYVSVLEETWLQERERKRSSSALSLLSDRLSIKGLKEIGRNLFNAMKWKENITTTPNMNRPSTTTNSNNNSKDVSEQKLSDRSRSVASMDTSDSEGSVFSTRDKSIHRRWSLGNTLYDGRTEDMDNYNYDDKNTVDLETSPIAINSLVFRTMESTETINYILPIILNIENNLLHCYHQNNIINNNNNNNKELLMDDLEYVNNTMSDKEEIRRDSAGRIVLSQAQILSNVLLPIIIKHLAPVNISVFIHLLCLYVNILRCPLHMEYTTTATNNNNETMISQNDDDYVSVADLTYSKWNYPINSYSSQIKIIDSINILLIKLMMNSCNQFLQMQLIQLLKLKYFCNSRDVALVLLEEVDKMKYFINKDNDNNSNNSDKCKQNEKEQLARNINNYDNVTNQMITVSNNDNVMIIESLQQIGIDMLIELNEVEYLIKWYLNHHLLYEAIHVCVRDILPCHGNNADRSIFEHIAAKDFLECAIRILDKMIAENKAKGILGEEVGTDGTELMYFVCKFIRVWDPEACRIEKVSFSIMNCLRRFLWQILYERIVMVSVELFYYTGYKTCI